MTAALLILALVVASLLVALPFLFVQVNRRRRDRMAAWLCPQCGKPFGQEAAAHWRGWRGDIQWTDQMFGQPYAGPLLHCYKCVQDVRFTWDGKAVGTEENHGAPEGMIAGGGWGHGSNDDQALRLLMLIMALLGLAILVALLVLIWKLAA